MKKKIYLVKLSNVLWSKERRDCVLEVFLFLIRFHWAIDMYIYIYMCARALIFNF